MAGITLSRRVSSRQCVWFLRRRDVRRMRGPSEDKGMKRGPIFPQQPSLPCLQDGSSLVPLVALRNAVARLDL